MRFEEFGVPQKRRKKRRLGISENGIARRSARGVNDVWCMDFVHDSDERGRSLRWLTIVDEKRGFFMSDIVFKSPKSVCQ